MSTSTGAYTFAMASNYNRVPKSGVVAVTSSGVAELVNRQSFQEAKKGRTVFHIKYSDTDAMFDRQVKNALRKFGIPEDVIQQQTFKYV